MGLKLDIRPSYGAKFGHSRDIKRHHFKFPAILGQKLDFFLNIETESKKLTFLRSKLDNRQVM